MYDENKVFTAVNAYKLSVGSCCVFGDTLEELKTKINNLNRVGGIQRLDAVLGEEESNRFESSGVRYSLAYLVQESSFKPYSTVEKAFEALIYEDFWIKNKLDTCLRVSGFSFKEGIEKPICINGTWTTLEDLFKNYTFLNGTLCGVSEF